MNVVEPNYDRDKRIKRLQEMKAYAISQMRRFMHLEEQLEADIAEEMADIKNNEAN